MILDAETLELVELDRDDARGGTAADGRGQARADGVGARDRDQPVPQTRARPAPSCATLRAQVSRARPRERGLAIGSAGTHPFAMWEDQRIVARPALPRPGRRRCGSWPARS